MPQYHTSVLQKEVIRFLQCRPGGIYVDGTIGGGGHAYEILQNSGPDGLLVGIDMDEDALAESKRRLEFFKDRAIIVKGNFAQIDTILTNLNIHDVDGILLDLGVSSHQLDTPDRGFSFSLDAMLDMRMDRDGSVSAYDLINSLEEKELKKIIREYGDEIMAGRIARAISAQRCISPIKTTIELADIITRAMPSPMRKGKIHPATKTFQAIRIFVNEELLNLHKAIDRGIASLKTSGRLLIISFHSLEDRIVKSSFRLYEKGCVCPSDFPVCICQEKPRLKVLTKRPITPQKEEIASNPRARSAKLRIAEKV